VEAFKKMIYTEYIDFFKNRKRIKNDIAVFSEGFKDKFEKLLFMSTEQTIKIGYLQKFLPILDEKTNITHEMLV